MRIVGICNDDIITAHGAQTMFKQWIGVAPGNPGTWTPGLRYVPLGLGSRGAILGFRCLGLGTNWIGVGTANPGVRCLGVRAKWVGMATGNPGIYVPRLRYQLSSAANGQSWDLGTWADAPIDLGWPRAILGLGYLGLC